VAGVQLRGSPFTDAEEVLPTCYRCGSSNPLVNAQVSSHASPLAKACLVKKFSISLVPPMHSSLQASAFLLETCDVAPLALAHAEVALRQQGLCMLRVGSAAFQHVLSSVIACAAGRCVQHVWKWCCEIIPDL
jgi:hypothetical protein